MLLSVIIPCYNHGQYIHDAIDSVLTYTDKPIEIIIVDDGSADDFTIRKMTELKEAGFHVIQQPNSGLAKARNAGIEAAKGKYILPLDADNKIRADYIRKSLPILEANECDIVYAKPDFFGDNIESRKFLTKKFNGTDLIHGNYIDACSIFKKSIWEENQGYDENMPYQGYEDWDFWLNSYFRGFRFHFLDEELYEYRILTNSMISKSLDNKKYDLSFNYLLKKYAYNIYQAFYEANGVSQIYYNDKNRPFRSAIKYLLIGIGKFLS